MKRIYLDYAATTPVLEEVVRAMEPYHFIIFGNPSSQHSFGREARDAVDGARDRIAACLGCRASEVVFTASGSEANNLAVRGVVEAKLRAGGVPRVITAATEHHSVLNTVLSLRGFGCEVEVLSVDKYGVVSPDDLRAALNKPADLVTIMFANNEVGTIQPVKELGRVAKERGALFHVDAVQAVGAVPLNFSELPVDMVSLSAHKFYGPKGTGALVVRSGVKLSPMILGGAQERERRAGTENVAGIVGMATALEIACASMGEHAAEMQALRERLVCGILERVEGVHLNGHPKEKLPGIANVSFERADGETLLLALDLAGVACSGGSACMSGALEPSHVLLAMGVPRELASSSVRFSLGRPTTQEEVDAVVELLPGIVKQVREQWKQSAR
ncbi:MAG: cysteine desulfurase family protein [Armatimonadota bacterium]